MPGFGLSYVAHARVSVAAASGGPRYVHLRGVEGKLMGI
jgi:hypothetical protein